VLDVGLPAHHSGRVAAPRGVSRMTVYRQYGDLGTLVSSLLTASCWL
jgi:hypothetical protein